MESEKYPVSRRSFIKVTAASTAAVSTIGLSSCKVERVPEPMKRKFGNLNFEVTTLGLGGQASIQWTPRDVDPVTIILKAFDLGINYFDTSNLYDYSQLHFHKAFEKLNLIPGKENYDSKLRSAIWLTSKTAMRWGKPGWPEAEGVNNRSNGEQVQCAVDDVKRTLTQVFGDNKGWYPEGAYLDMVLCHTLNTEEEVNVLYKGLETPLDPNGNFGALVALRDLRDGTNHTGMNPKEEKLIRHIGFSGHGNPMAMMEMLQRDEYGILEGMLVAINANDKTRMNMQHNVIPLAAKKGLGIIGMKVFADAAMYHKEARWSEGPEDVYRKVGTPDLPSKTLIEYSLTTPGVHTLIIGIGHVDDNPMLCQLVQNFYAAQIAPDGMSEEERRRIEIQAAKLKPGSNYFQRKQKTGLGAPRDPEFINGVLSWHTAYAGDHPISHYEVTADGEEIGKVVHDPQVLKSEPFSIDLENEPEQIVITAVDAAGKRTAYTLTV